jgi:Xaa-Pro aminopeptidase
MPLDKIEIPGFRALKNDNELNAMQCAITACEAAIEKMRAVM